MADVGCYDFVYTYGKYSVDTFHVGKVYVEKNAPIAYKKTSDALQPAIAATKKGYLTADAYVREKTPIVVDKVRKRFSGI